MNRINGINGCNQTENLGWITEAIGAGASIFNTISNNRGDKKANQSAERQLQLQLEAQRLANQSQSSSQEQIAKTVKMAIIGVGSLLVGGIVLSAIVKNSSKKTVDGIPARKGKKSTTKNPKK